MQGSPNAERLMNRMRKFFEITAENYNRAYSICMSMKVVYANVNEELKVLFDEFHKAGIKRKY